MSAVSFPQDRKIKLPTPSFWFFEAIVGRGDYISAAVWPICQMTILKNENNVKWLIPVKIRVNSNERISVCIFVVWCYGYFWYLYHILCFYRQSAGIIEKTTFWENKYPLIWFSALMQMIWLDNLQRKEIGPNDVCMFEIVRCAWMCIMFYEEWQVGRVAVSLHCDTFLASWKWMIKNT